MATQTESGIFCRGIAVSVAGRQILRDVTFSIACGTIAVITGENGAGKTVLLNLLSGLIRPNGGIARLSLNSVVDPSDYGIDQLARMGLGRLFQDDKLFPDLTALENVALADPSASNARACGQLLRPVAATKAWREQCEKARALLETFRLGPAVNKRCRNLSGGEMKRVAIARLMNMEPRVLLLDEPLAALDDEGITEVNHAIQQLANRDHVTVLCIEHRLHHAEKIADLFFELAEGIVRKVSA